MCGVMVIMVMVWCDGSGGRNDGDGVVVTVVVMMA